MEEHNYFVFKFNDYGVNVKATSAENAAAKIYNNEDVVICNPLPIVKGLEPIFFTSDVYVVKTDNFEDSYYFTENDYNSNSVVGFKVK